MEHIATPESSTVASYAYDGSGVLKVVFNNGKAYEYHGVSPDTASGFAASKSKGSFVNAKLKGAYRTKKG